MLNEFRRLFLHTVIGENAMIFLSIVKLETHIQQEVCT